MSKVSISICLLFLLVLALNLEDWLADSPIQTTENTEEAWQPNYQANEMQSTLYDKQGNINHLVYAQHMEHYQLLGFTLFEHPQYTIFTQEQDRPWKISATEGTLYDDNRLHLEDNVIVQSMDKEGFVQTMQTDFIEINLDSRTLTSDQIVTITGKNYVMQGTGFSANLDKRTFELLNHVKSTFAPGLIN
ncbi:LPS export ABC transporter periplasmic protein LptC [Neptunicella sp. SCSIO 80796]|uniref:LPS export ABC transporter periplasmic protein LptC n=1 Tax=Neptunicella plasticusilytica TaxID=3117012 RepID=UPI003A4D5DF8